MIEKELNKLLEFIILKLQEELLLQGHVAEPSLIHNLTEQVTKITNGYNAEIKAPAYWKNVNYGTPPGTNVDLARLRTWIKQKYNLGFKIHSTAEAIQIKIKKKGTSPYYNKAFANFLEKTLIKYDSYISQEMDRICNEIFIYDMENFDKELDNFDKELDKIMK